MAQAAPASLVIEHQPPAEWYKDEGDKFFEFALRVNGTMPASMKGAHVRVPVHITLLYESGKVVEDQHSLLECLPPAPIMELSENRCSCRIRIKEVSSRHRHQQFVLKAELGGLDGLNFVLTDPIRVLSKHTRHNRKRKRAKAAADTDGFDPTLAKQDPVKLTVEVLRSLEWIKIGRDKSVHQCPSCNAVYLVGVNSKIHKPRCKLRHLVSVFSRAPQGAPAPAAAATAAAGAPTTAASAPLPTVASLLPTPREPKRRRGGAAAAAATASAAPGVPDLALGSAPSFDFENQMALELVDSIPNEQSTLGKLARNFSIGSLVRSFSWGRSASTDQHAQQQ